MDNDKQKIKEQKRNESSINFYHFLNENGGFYTKKDLINLGFEEGKINQLLKLNFSSVIPELSEDLYHKSQFDGEKLIKNYSYISKVIKNYSDLSNVVLIQFFVYLKSFNKKIFTKKELDKIAFEQLSFEMGR